MSDEDDEQENVESIGCGQRLLLFAQESLAIGFVISILIIGSINTWIALYPENPQAITLRASRSGPVKIGTGAGMPSGFILRFSGKYILLYYRTKPRR